MTLYASELTTWWGATVAATTSLRALSNRRRLAVPTLPIVVPAHDPWHNPRSMHSAVSEIDDYTDSEVNGLPERKKSRAGLR